MLIQIHAIQNHSPANLNRDDLGAPKSCWFGGVQRARISSQCLKRSIRKSDEFKKLLGGVRTRQLASLISSKVAGKADVKKKAVKILKEFGIDEKNEKDGKTSMLVYTTFEAVNEMSRMLQNDDHLDDESLMISFKKLLEEKVASPDIALSGRMLETGILENTTVEAALQVAHAISTHTCIPEVDYFVAADDLPGNDAGAGHLGETLFTSATFYKYFSINWELLVRNLNGNYDLAAHTVGAFINAMARTSPSGKQNSFAAHNYPDGIMVEIRPQPVSYANAFARPVAADNDIIGKSLSQLRDYAIALDNAYGEPTKRFFFTTMPFPTESLQVETVFSLEDMIGRTINHFGYNWDNVKVVGLQEENLS